MRSLPRDYNFYVSVYPRDSFPKQGLTWIQKWLSNDMPINVREMDEIIDPLPNNFNPHLIIDVITYQVWD